MCRGRKVKTFLLLSPALKRSFRHPAPFSSPDSATPIDWPMGICDFKLQFEVAQTSEGKGDACNCGG
jgi:hypothetical protein